MAALAQPQGGTAELKVGDVVRINAGLAAGEVGRVVRRFDVSRYLLVRFHRWASDWEFLYLPDELQPGPAADRAAYTGDQ